MFKMKKIWLLLLVLIFSGISSSQAQDIHEVENQFYSTKAINKSADFSKQRTLLIRSAESLRGKIFLQASDRKDISFSYRKQARAANRSVATDFIDLISVAVKTTPDMVVLSLKAPNPAPWNSETETGLIEMRISLPNDFAVELEATYFSLVSEGDLRAIAVPNSLGSFDIDGITEELTLATKNQRVTLNNISGRINVATTNAPLKATNIISPSGPAAFRNEGGEIDIEGIIGQVNARNKFGRISITSFELVGDANFIRSVSGPVEVALISANEGQLVINNRYEDISISIPDTLSVYMSLSVDENGTIEATGFPFKTDLVEQDRLNLISGEGTVEIVSSIRGKGSIFVTGIEGDDL